VGLIYFRHRIIINCPIEKVFEFISNPQNRAKWDSSVADIRITSDGPIKAGTTGVSVGMFKGKQYESEFIYDEYDSPNMLVLKTTSGPVKVKMRNTLTEVEGGTQVVFKVQGNSRGLLSLLGPIIGSKMEKEIKNNLIAMKDYLENEGASK